MNNNNIISNINFDDKIPGAPNFTYNEFIRSDTAKRLNIDNTPSQFELNNIINLAVNVLQPLRNHFGPIKINSGFRSLKLNEAIGGSLSSNHIRGEAADIEPLNKNIPLMTLLEYIYYQLDYRELIAEYFPNGWVHVAYRKDDNTRILKLKDETHNYKKIDLLYLQKLYL